MYCSLLLLLIPISTVTYILLDGNSMHYYLENDLEKQLHPSLSTVSLWKLPRAETAAVVLVFQRGGLAELSADIQQLLALRCQPT